MENEKLASIRRRIQIIREALEDPSLITEITVDGVSERVDRRTLREELKELEAEESRLSGKTSRIYGIKFS